MFRNILVSVDGSQHADKALTEAIDIATLTHARLTILTAIPRPASWTSTPMTAAVAEELNTGLERQYSEILREARDRVPGSIPVTTILSREPIRAALSSQLHSNQYDLLVIGSRGRGAVASSLLGSVSHYALNHSPVPVLIVHADAVRGEAVGNPGAPGFREPERMVRAAP
jgi:nucleotide-binding universal stress UspA family protein